MSKYFLINPTGDAQTIVKSCITEIGDSYLEFNSVSEASASGESPHVVLLFAGTNMANFQNDISALKMRPFFAKIARILFVPKDIAQTVLQSRALEGEMIFHLPVDKAQLISRLSVIKKRAHRRIFEILMRIQPKGSNLMYFGKSVDFSETGIAFQTEEAFEIGQKVAISFVNSRDKTRFVLASEIVRKSILSAGASLYGARFENVQQSVLRNLIDFISGESSS